MNLSPLLRCVIFIRKSDDGLLQDQNGTALRVMCRDPAGFVDEALRSQYMESAMPSLSAERNAIKIADEFIAAEFDDDAEAIAWLAKKIKAALEEAEQAGYAKAMRKRF